MLYSEDMQRKFSFVPNEYYHIYSRGTDKREIFLDENEYKRFVKLLFVCNSKISVHLSSGGNARSPLEKIKRGETLVDIGAYCLMPNHFHLLIHEKEDDGITNFLKKLLTSYSMFFNKKHDRTGSLFEGIFRAKHVGQDEYLEYLFAYIHLNPIKIKEPKWGEDGLPDIKNTKKFLDDFRHSSYLDYVGKGREESVILNREPFPEYFSTPKDHKDFVDSWMRHSEDFKEE